jgi:hypothetical protein
MRRFAGRCLAQSMRDGAQSRRNLQRTWHTTANRLFGDLAAFWPGLTGYGEGWRCRRALRHVFMPFVDHGSSCQLRSLAGAGDDSSGLFDVCRMDGYGPSVPLDPSADRVSDPPVLHRQAFSLDGPGRAITSWPEPVSKGQMVSSADQAAEGTCLLKLV